jgi:hypothetical protein
MKFFMLLAAVALIVGAIYHTEVSRYVSQLADGSSRSGSGRTVVHSIQRTGKSTGALMNRVGNALGH